MATITTSTTVQAKVSGATTRYRFKYELDNGEVHYRIAWVPSTTDEATERTSRGVSMLVELADAEASLLIGSNNG